MNRWDYSHVAAFPYDDETMYVEGMTRLKDCEVVEDWGCGTAWAKRYRTGTYIGVDWAPGFADVVADLHTYTSRVDGIYMRGVLEHNEDWQPILDNALASAPHLVLVLFTPMAAETSVIAVNGRGIPDISFAAGDIEARFKRPFTFKDYATDTQYGTERLYEVTGA